MSNAVAAPRLDIQRAQQVTAELAARAHALTYDDLPPHVVRFAKTLLLDTLAVAWAAGDAAGMAGARAVALAEAGPGLATLWGKGGERVSPGAAAFANGSLAAALDYDSLFEPAGTHGDIVVLPAALAVAEQQRAGGRDLLTAYALGADLVYRLGLAGSGNTGWFRTTIYGVFGAALAAGRLLALDVGQLHHALGIALNHAGGTQQPHIEQRLTKRLSSAFAARGGVFSAQLAAHGITGPSEPLEGRFGLFALFEQGEPARALEGFGRDFVLLDTSLKRFPACACSHAAIQAALDLAQEHAIAIDDVAGVEVIITPYQARLVGGAFAPQADPQVTGQFNVAYGVATALLRGRFALADIEPATVLDPAILPVIAKIAVRVDERRAGRLAPGEVVIALRDGRSLRRRVDILPGGPAARLGDSEIATKLADAFAHGPAALSPQRRDLLIERVWDIERCEDVSTLFAGIV